MLGEAASELIRDITRDSGEIIPEYQHGLVQQVIRENNELFAENVRTSQTVPPGEKTSEQTSEQADQQDGSSSIDEKDIMVMQARHTAKLWNKRCLIAYHYERLKRLKRLRWEYGNKLPKEIEKHLSKEELEWFAKYNNNLFEYMISLKNDGQGNIGLDLTKYITPPKRLYIQVKCVRDYGQFDLEDGQPVMLKKDSIHFLPLNQCEKLIHQGVLEQTSR